MCVWFAQQNFRLDRSNTLGLSSRMSIESNDKKNENPIKTAILSLIEASEDGATIGPADAARYVSDKEWRKLLKDVRSEAVRLANSQEISIYRKGKPVDPNKFKGVYRLGRYMNGK